MIGTGEQFKSAAQRYESRQREECGICDLEIVETANEKKIIGPEGWTVTLSKLYGRALSVEQSGLCQYPDEPISFQYDFEEAFDRLVIEAETGVFELKCFLDAIEVNGCLAF